jgi:hypothetical protein
MTKFELNEKEEERLTEAVKAIKVLYGEDVKYKVTYCFSYTGIGVNVKVIITFGEMTIEKDITDYDSW